MRSKQIPLLLGLFAGGWVIVLRMFNHPSFADLLRQSDVWNQLSGAIAILIGAISIVRYHTTVVKRRRNEWYLSAYLLAVVAIVLLLGFVLEGNNVAPFYQWIINNFSAPAGAAIYAILGFYIASAAYRAFRFRTFESTVLLVSAIIVLIGRAPISNAVWTGFADIATWIVDIPNTGAVRAITIGSHIGSFAMAVRILVGLERGHLGASD